MKTKCLLATTMIFVGLISSLIFSVGNLNAQEMIDENGLTVVKPFKGDSDRYTADNKIYTPNLERVYSYVYANGDTAGFVIWEPTKEELQLKVLHLNDIDSSLVHRVKMSVEPDMSIKEGATDYNRTVVKYEYISQAGQVLGTDYTGMVENEENIMLPPPNQELFKMLEMNPYPFVKFPLEMGKKYTWEQTVSDTWGNDLWKSWEGDLENKCTYRVDGHKYFETPLGEIKCYLIQGEVENRLGRSQLTAYYHEEFGFVQLDYTNIDGSILFIQLEEIIDKNKPKEETKEEEEGDK